MWNGPIKWDGIIIIIIAVVIAWLEGKEILMVALFNLLLSTITKVIIIFLLMKIKSKFDFTISGKNCCSNKNNYSAQIMYKGLVRNPDQGILPISSKKDDNTVFLNSTNR